MITVINQRGCSVPYTILEAIRACETAFRAMVNTEQKLSIAGNPSALTIHSYFLINRYTPGPAIVFIGSPDEIADLKTRIDEILASGKYSGIFDNE